VVGREFRHTLLRVSILRVVRYPVHESRDVAEKQELIQHPPAVKYYAVTKSYERLVLVPGYSAGEICRQLREIKRHPDTYTYRNCKYQKPTWREWPLSESELTLYLYPSYPILRSDALNQYRLSDIRIQSYNFNNRHVTYHAVLNETQNPLLAHSVAYST
jgi:hypothetical protein